MSVTLPKDLLELSVAERIQLAEDLWDSVLAEPGEIALTSAHRIELDRRLNRFESNGVVGASWDDVKARLLQQQ